MSLHQPVNILLLPSLGGREGGREGRRGGRKGGREKPMCSMSGEDEEGEEREGSRSLRRLVMKALVEKRDTERVPQLDGALYLQLLLMMRLHCRDETKWGGEWKSSWI